RAPVGRAGGWRHPHPGRHRRHLGTRAPVASSSWAASPPPAHPRPATTTRPRPALGSATSLAQSPRPIAKEIPMPALPWTTISPPDRAREYVVMASRLPLARYRDIPGFLRAATLIRPQLARASGLIGYTLDAHLARKTFWTVSAWDSRD